MSRRAKQLPVDLPDLSVPLLAGALLVEHDADTVTVTVTLRGADADAARRRFQAAQATELIVPDRAA
jgi:hypothetical protein